MGVPQLHVGAVRGVADVQRVKHQQPAIVAVHDVLGQPLPAVFAHRWQVGQGQPCGFPFAKGKWRGPDLNTVGVIWGAIRQGGPKAWIDLAGLAVVLIHGDTLSLSAHQLADFLSDRM